MRLIPRSESTGKMLPQEKIYIYNFNKLFFEEWQLLLVDGVLRHHARRHHLFRDNVHLVAGIDGDSRMALLRRFADNVRSVPYLHLLPYQAT